MRSHRMWPLAGLCVLGGGCDLPTDAPIIEQRWILPLEVVTLDQEELLPAGISIVGDSYSVAIADISASESLGGLCAPCVALEGLTVPVPASLGSFTSSQNLPADVVSADVVSGSIDITITNGLSFDPLAGGGSFTITVRGASGGPVLGTLVLDGATDALAPASVTTRTMVVTAGTVTGAIETTVLMDNVGGQVATIGVADRIEVAAVTTSLLVGAATVDVDGTPVSLTQAALDLEGLESNITDGIQSGTAVLEVTNPFGLSFVGTIVVGPVTKVLSVPSAPTSTVLITYSGDELRSFLGVADITLSGSGTIGGGPAILTPSTELSIDTSIDLIVQIGR